MQYFLKCTAVCIIILVILLTLFTYNKTVNFHKCTRCGNSEVYIIPSEPVQSSTIDKIVDVFHKDNTHTVLNSLNNVKGSKMNYNQIMSNMPELRDIFMSDTLRNRVSDAVGHELHYAPPNEKYRLFMRLYENQDDKLEWHYDNNFTNGVRYTFVMPIYIDDCNTSHFMIKDQSNGEEKLVNINVGEGVLYNGSDVYHKISPQTLGCKRLVVIIPFYSNYSMSMFGNIRYRFRTILYNLFNL